MRPTRDDASPGYRRDVDDVVVNDVEMVRLEQMDRNYWFLCCFLRGENPENRIAFDVRYDPGEDDVMVRVTEWPGGVVYEEGAGPDDRAT